MEIIFSGHALKKFEILHRHGFDINKGAIELAVENPDSIMPGYKGRKIAQKAISETHLIRVVIEEAGDTIKIVTFYPARRDRYESNLQ